MSSSSPACTTDRRQGRTAATPAERDRACRTAQPAPDPRPSLTFYSRMFAENVRSCFPPLLRASRRGPPFSGRPIRCTQRYQTPTRSRRVAFDTIMDELRRLSSNACWRSAYGPAACTRVPVETSRSASASPTNVLEEHLSISLPDAPRPRLNARQVARPLAFRLAELRSTRPR